MFDRPARAARRASPLRTHLARNPVRPPRFSGLSSRPTASPPPSEARPSPCSTRPARARARPAPRAGLRRAQAELLPRGSDVLSPRNELLPPRHKLLPRKRMRGLRQRILLTRRGGRRSRGSVRRLRQRQRRTRLAGGVLPTTFLRLSAIRGGRDVAQSGSAPEWGSGGRGFESRRPDSLKIKSCRGFLGHRQPATSTSRTVAPRSRSSRAARYSRIASWMFSSASCSVSPWDQHPGSPGTDTL